MDWCPVCCTRHESKSDCPGELLATGPERHGRRVTVAAHGRNEVYGVLIAEAGEHWRARVLTYPNMLWSVPGAKGTLKFVGKSPQEVEGQAVTFILELCKARGYKVVEQAAEAKSAKVDQEADAVQAPTASRHQRYLRTYAVHFGSEKQNEMAKTGDLSRGGLLVVTEAPLPAGSPVRLRLELEGFTVPLSGTVAWARKRAEEGRPAGMGVQLRNPPGMYTRFVRALEENKPKDAPKED
jgi:hypothetical protein